MQKLQCITEEQEQLRHEIQELRETVRKKDRKIEQMENEIWMKRNIHATKPTTAIAGPTRIANVETKTHDRTTIDAGDQELVSYLPRGIGNDNTTSQHHIAGTIGNKPHTNHYTDDNETAWPPLVAYCTPEESTNKANDGARPLSKREKANRHNSNSNTLSQQKPNQEQKCTEQQNRFR